MHTINQVLKASDGQLGHWNMWANDIVRRLDSLRITPRTHIAVEYTPTEYTLNKQGELDCQHVSEHLEKVYDWEGDSYECMPICDACDAMYNGEEWIG